MSVLLFVMLLLVVYQIKHFLADYIFQGEYQLGKFKPGWDFFLPLLSHVAYHAAGTFLIAVGAFLLCGMQGYLLAGLLAMFDATVHFFMDRIKAGPKYMGRWKPLTAKDYQIAKAQDFEGEPDPNVGCGYGLDRMLKTREEARKKLRGNKLFWWALGFDQMVHHLTHYVCIFIIVLAVMV